MDLYSRECSVLPMSSRKQLIDLDNDRIAKQLSGDEYVLNKLRIAGINLILYPRNKGTNDDGVDFILMLGDEYIIIQLKWWDKPINEKQIKCIFGEMYLSANAFQIRKMPYQVNYVILAPLLSKKVLQNANNLATENYYLISNERFIRFLNNPLYFLINHLKEIV